MYQKEKEIRFLKAQLIVLYLQSELAPDNETWLMHRLQLAALKTQIDIMQSQPIPKHK